MPSGDAGRLEQAKGAIIIRDWGTYGRHLANTMKLNSTKLDRVRYPGLCDVILTSIVLWVVTSVYWLGTIAAGRKSRRRPSKMLAVKLHWRYGALGYMSPRFPTIYFFSVQFGTGLMHKLRRRLRAVISPNILQSVWQQLLWFSDEYIYVFLCDELSSFRLSAVLPLSLSHQLLVTHNDVTIRLSSSVQMRWDGIS